MSRHKDIFSFLSMIGLSLHPRKYPKTFLSQIALLKIIKLFKLLYQKINKLKNPSTELWQLHVLKSAARTYP